MLSSCMKHAESYMMNTNEFSLLIFITILGMIRNKEIFSNRFLPTLDISNVESIIAMKGGNTSINDTEIKFIAECFKELKGQKWVKNLPLTIVTLIVESLSLRITTNSHFSHSSNHSSKREVTNSFPHQIRQHLVSL